ncbi:hypothetical protein NEF87_000365 [Candidatus Lokiarchaeum ossiferum]|uniref:Methyltransferase type 11 domain-containing protein n=1 Tax=Candidatus Lokiarchaeum ossiferum TaxID=2951803 RepID=A0ABY6HKM7_9ARCH|nr:hypothetical protein NEF87_000365 [Candidatus Lokiarchaeum sp. B-35]
MMDFDLPDPKTRFTSRSKYFSKFRPSYPNEIINLLKKKRILQETTTIADIGSGTGILSELFLKENNLVYGIEPNSEMRQESAKLLQIYPNFQPLNGSAEATSLRSDSIDLITVGQAFHWFDMKQAIFEFKRILKSRGTVLLVWNLRKTVGSSFNEIYEDIMLKYGSDYAYLKKPLLFENFFPNNHNEYYHFETQQLLDFQGFIGRTLSSSYIPLEKDPQYAPMYEELKNIFYNNQIQGKVVFEYNTEMIISYFDK